MPLQRATSRYSEVEGSRNIDLAADGKRLVVGRSDSPTDQKGTLHVTFLLNFFDELRRRMLTGSS
jgi:pectate lyase